MDLTVSVRCFAVLFLVGGGMGAAQSSLPATSPTASPAVVAPRGSRATVMFTGGKLQVTADNSSLNQILRDISRQTGMVVTGGVVDERVFGSYGPASPAEVLTSLLDGTGSNMLLIAGQSGVPEKLILTPRQGGPSPPNPNASASEDGARDDDRPAVENPHIGGPGPRREGNAVDSTAAKPADGEAPESSTPSAAAAPAGGTPAAADSTPAAGSAPAATPATTGGPPLTPEQIYQQLQNLQRAQPQP